MSDESAVQYSGELLVRAKLVPLSLSNFENEEQTKENSKPCKYEFFF